MSILKKLFPDFLKTGLKRFIYDIPYQSHYSQSGEDVVLKSIFWPRLEKGYKGIYVDVGAYHPVSKSNTYFFYQHGWSGINVEPNPKNLEDFARIRPRDKTLNLAISNDPSQKLYYCYVSDIGLMNHVTFEKPANGKFVEVQHVRLSELLDKNLPVGSQIDFLSVDTEGFDVEVLKSNNWQKYRPKVILTEVNVEEIKDIFETSEYKYLDSIGYKAIGKLPIVQDISTLLFIDRDFNF
jgi:FkbM family methyltransferase